MDVPSEIYHEKNRTAKLALLWALFVLALIGIYLLSHKIESGSYNAAAAFLSSGTSHKINLFSNRADPVYVSANTGDEVIFVVKDSGRHDISEERSQRKDARLESGEIGQYESYSLIFHTPGTFSFYDRLNQDIRVIVSVR